MKNIFSIITIVFCLISFSQQKEYFYVEFANSSQIPKVTNNNDGTINLTFLNKNINSLYQKYIIYNFESLAKYAKSENLQNTYSIECNNISLMNELRSSFPNIFVKVEQHKPHEILYTPNDYSILPPYNGYNFETRYLDRINAQNAWDLTHGLPNVVIGINESGMNYLHEDLIDKVLNPYTYTGNWHATGVAGFSAGDTNNGVGIASIGFDCNLAQGGFNELVSNNSKVINMSWGSGFIPYIDTTTGSMVNIPSQIEQNNFNDLSEQQNIVLVAAAGNGVGGNVYAGQLTSNGLAITSENYSNVRHFPASYKNVISVSTVGNWNQPYTTATNFDNWINMHRVTTPPNTHYNGTSTLVIEPEIFHQHNDSVDIVVPAYRLPVVGGGVSGYWETHDLGGWSGTSFSAPIVSGTIGLMFSVNYCLKPKEIESILKLTALNIENLPENFEFYGRLGGGSLDAFKAVEMANEMAKPYGTVNVIDRLLYRNWFYKLETAPYQIKMSNNKVTDGAKVKFFARNDIDVLSGDYKPTAGYIDLQINASLSLNCSIPTSKINVDEKIYKSIPYPAKIKLYPNPNTGVFTISIIEKEVKDINIEIFDIFGKSVFKTVSNNSNTEINMQNFAEGVYLVKLNSNTLSEVLKFIKK